MNHSIQFYDYEQLISDLNQLASEHPYMEVAYLGKSILGRSIPFLRIGNGNRGVLYVGAHHGMEWITAAILVRFATDFCTRLSEKGKIGKILPNAIYQTHSLYILPMLNPDGVEYQIHGINQDNPLYERLLTMNKGSEDFSHWQANARGVDLNHNYDAGFWEYKKIEAKNGIENGAPTRFSGEAPESEPEVRLLCDWIRYHEELKGALTLHTQGEEIFCGVPEQNRRIDSIAERICKKTGYLRSVAYDSAAYGGMTDWCLQQGLPSFTIECGKGENPLPFAHLEMIYRELQELLFSFPTLL